MELWTIARGDGPLIVDVPHCGTHVPADVRSRLSVAARSLPDTDWHVEKLYAFVPATGATLMCATHSRYVVDLNRDPGGVALYPGADNTEICPSRTFLDDPIYAEGAAPQSAEIAARIDAYWRPYHAQLAREIVRVKQRHGYALLLDGHSILAEVPRFFAGRLPDLNLGTADGLSADAGLAQRALAVLAEAPPLSHVLDGRFKGGYITRHYGRPGERVHALQLEMTQSSYMDEKPPYAWDPTRAAALVPVLRRLVDTLLAWRPTGST